MPSIYTNVPITTEPDAIAQIGFDSLQVKWPDWTPHDGQLSTQQITAIARMVAELRDVAADVPPSIFRYFGASLMGLSPLAAISATVPTTWNVKDAAGYTIPAGTAAGIRDSAGILHAFQTTADVTIPAGSAATAAGAVLLSAVDAGAAASGLGVGGTALEMITSLDYVTSVNATATSSGGQDAEDDTVYLNRLTADLALQAPRPILPADFATFARNVSGVGRALALDGYDAVALTSGNARTITVAVADISGNAVTSAIKAAVLALLQASREVNFLVYVIDPTYTTIDVQWDVNMYPGWDPAAVSAAINSAINAYLSSATWGAPPYGDVNGWVQQSTSYFRDLIAIVGRQDGVKDVNFAKQRTGAAAYAEADIALTGAAPLARPGLVSGTVH